MSDITPHPEVEKATQALVEAIVAGQDVSPRLNEGYELLIWLRTTEGEDWSPYTQGYVKGLLDAIKIAKLIGGE